MLLEIALGIQVVLNFFGFVGVIYWLVRQMKALRGAVEAQEQTIRAQAEGMKAQSEVLKSLEGLLRTMRVVLESTDEPKMLERVRAYKEFVDKEKEAALNHQAQEFEEKKNLMTAEQQRTFRLITELETTLVNILADLFPYIPSEERLSLINSISLPEPLKSEEVRERLRPNGRSRATSYPNGFGPRCITAYRLDRGGSSYSHAHHQTRPMTYRVCQRDRPSPYFPPEIGSKAGASGGK